MLNPRESVKFPLANLHPPASAALKTNSRRVRNQGSLKLRSMKILSWQLAERVCSTITCNPRNRKAFVLLCRMGCSIKITEDGELKNCENSKDLLLKATDTRGWRILNTHRMHTNHRWDPASGVTCRLEWPWISTA